MPDHYTYPGTEVLVNRLGLSDPVEWKAVETAAIGQRMIELARTPVTGAFDLAHLQEIHRRLTLDLYDWGGRLRDTDTGPGGTPIAHCRPAFIPAEAHRIFTALADTNQLRGRDADAFSSGLAWVWGETTVLHPFRDVNTRSQFVFYNQLAEHAGWVIDWTRIDPDLFAHARTIAIVRDATGIDALLRPALLRLDQATRQDELRDRLTQASASFTVPRPPRTRRQLDAALAAALQQRSRTLSAPPPPTTSQQPPGRSIGL